MKQIVNWMRYEWTPVFCIIGLCFLILACHRQVIDAEPASEKVEIKRILVLPFKNMTKKHGENASVRCPICRTFFVTGSVEKDAEEVITSLLFSELEKHKNLIFIHPGDMEEIMSGFLPKTANNISELELLMKVGKYFQADAVLMGGLYRYIERVGNEYSVESPASVSFDMGLIRVKDGRLLWNDHYDETQYSLFENIFHLDKFIKRSGKWISAEKMTLSGIDEMFQTFPMALSK